MEVEVEVEVVEVEVEWYSADKQGVVSRRSLESLGTLRLSVSLTILR